MGRIVIRDKKPGNDRNSKVWEILGTNEIHPWKVNESKSNFIIIIKDEEIEKIINDDVRTQFRNNDFEVSIPPEYNSKRTVMIKGIDKHFDKLEDRKIKESIETRYPHLRVTEVIKIKNGNFRGLKLKFKTIEMAKSVLDKGIIIGNQSFPSHQIEEEIFIPIIPCYNCFKYDHKTRECPIEKQTICSNCSQEHHTYKECKNPPKCINCQGPHGTLQAKCKVRKDLIKEGIKKLKENQPTTQNISYAQAITGPRQQQQQQAQAQKQLTAELPKNAATTIMTALIAGHIQEAIKPGSFQKTVDQVYQLNGLPKVKLPTNWNHPEILNYLGIDTKQLERKRKEIQEAKKKNKQGEEEREYEEERESDQETDKDPVAMEESDIDITDTTEAEREIDELYTETKKISKERKRRLTLSPALQLNKEPKITHYTSHESLSDEINLHELKLCIYVPQGNRINIKSRTDKIRVLEAYVNGHLKATWQRREWSRENIKTLLNTNKERIMEYIKIRKIENREYEKINDGYITN